MRVSEVMTPNVERLPPDAALSEAGMKMREHDIGVVPVYEGDRLIGMITDRDIAIRAVANGKSPGEMTVREAMSPGISYCFDDQDIREAGKRLCIAWGGVAWGTDRLLNRGRAHRLNTRELPEAYRPVPPSAPS